MLRKISIAAALFALLPMAAMAGGKVVTHGKLQTTDAGAAAYPDGLKGKAKMQRRLKNNVGSTDVVLKVKGLTPDTEYPSHVHAATCDTGGGPHYQNEVGGDVDDVNEIWLTFTTDKKGKAKSKADHGHLAREDARSIVIHDHAGAPPARIACIDLK